MARRSGLSATTTLLRVVVDNKQAEAKLKETKKSVQDLGDSADDSGKKAAAGYNRLGLAITAVASAAVAAAAAIRALDAALTKGFEQNQMARAFANLTTAVGGANAALRELRVRTGGVISDAQLMEALIGTDATKAWQEYADSLGVTVEWLTEAQKQTILLDEATKELLGDVHSMRDGVLSLGEAWVSMKTLAVNAIDGLIRAIASIELPPWLKALLAYSTGVVGIMSGTTGALGVPGGGGGAPGGLELPPGGFTGPGTGQELPGLPGDLGRLFFDLGDEVAAFNANLALTNTLFDEGEINTQVHEAALQSLLKTYQELRELGVMPMIEQMEALIAVQDTQKSNTLALAAVYTQMAGQVTAALAAQFRDNKAVQYANTVVNTAAAIMGALATLPSPSAIPMAAMAASLGVIQLASISRAQPGSGGGVSAPGIGFNGPGDAAARPTTNVTVFLEGAGYIQDPDSFARDISDTIGEQLGRGGQTNIVEA